MKVEVIETQCSAMFVTISDRICDTSKVSYCLHFLMQAEHHCPKLGRRGLHNSRSYSASSSELRLLRADGIKTQRLPLGICLRYKP